MLTDKEIEDLRVNVFENIKDDLVNGPNQPGEEYTKLAVLMAEVASKVCAAMLKAFIKSTE